MQKRTTTAGKVSNLVLLENPHNRCWAGGGRVSPSRKLNDPDTCIGSFSFLFCSTN